MFTRSYLLKAALPEVFQLSRGLKSLVPMIKWIRPERLPSWMPEKSGDLEKLEYPIKNTIVPKYTQTELINEVDEDVKKIFTLDFQGKRTEVNLLTEELVKRVRRFEGDNSSAEVCIARMTAKIRVLQDYIAKHSRNGKAKTQCKELVDKRRKHLKYLRQFDYKKYEWLLEKLQIVNKAVPEDFSMVTRKISMVKLTDLYCDEIKNKKMAEYRKQLEAERQKLLKEYAENPLPLPNYVHKFDDEKQ